MNILFSLRCGGVRDVERGPGVLAPVLSVFLGGFQLPLLTRLSRMEAYSDLFPFGPSPLPLFALAGAILVGLWRWKTPSPHPES